MASSASASASASSAANNCETNEPVSNRCVHPIMSLIAIMMNYLNVSLYEGRFTYNDEQARARLNELYDLLTKVPFQAPPKEYIAEFYTNIKHLRNVTDTDDPDYGIMMRDLKEYIIMLESPLIYSGDKERWNKYTIPPSVDDEEDSLEEQCSHVYAEIEADPEWYDDTDWLQKEREDWTESIRSKNRRM